MSAARDDATPRSATVRAVALLFVALAFAGFVALPAPPSCWEILGLADTATPHQVQSAFRTLARRAHPDTGGSTADMAALNSARDEALRRIGAA